MRPLPARGLGKALVLDFAEKGRIERMRRYVRAGVASEIEEKEDQIRCIAVRPTISQGKPPRRSAGRVPRHTSAIIASKL